MLMADTLNVSLEPHLRDALTALLQILPEEISRELSFRLASQTDATTASLIPHKLILKTSKWCQTTDGKAALLACSPPLDPRSYTMVSLLAGTRTSPEKRFPPYIAKDPEEDQRLRTKERKAIATLVNAVLSIVGTGVATWWASQHTGMRLEWRALSAVFAALVVAFAEIVLYMIWDSRQTESRHSARRKLVVIRHKETAEGTKSDHDITPQGSSTAIGDANLRHRSATSAPNP